MPRILYAWEIGGGAGHLGKLAVVSSELRSRGHSLTAAVRDVVGASAHAGLRDLELLQVPVQAGVNRRIPTAVNFPEVLFQAGLNEAPVVHGFLRAWSTLIKCVAPDLIIAEYAPTAQLAAHAMGVPCAVIGTGFTVPPASTPMPSLQPWLQAQPEQRMRESEAQILDAFNAALVGFGRPALDALSTLYPPASTLMVSIPEMDHYQRSNGRFTNGLLSLGDSGPTPVWPPGDGPKVLAYYNGRYAKCEMLIRALAASALPTVIYVSHPQASIRAIAEESETLVLHDRPLNFQAGLASCDLVITHGGHGTTLEALLSGQPLLVVPYFLEQALAGYRLEKQGLAITATGDLQDLDVQSVYAQLQVPEAVQRRRALAKKYARSTTTTARAVLAEWLEEAL